MPPDSSFSPHVLVSADPADPGYVGLVNHIWTLRSQVEDAFVFPTARLAQRYADYMSAEYAGTFEVKPASSRLPHLSQNKACLFCGCIETFACPDGCCWVRPETVGGPAGLLLCSACVESLRAELEAEHANRPNDPALDGGFCLGERRALRYDAEVFNAEMARSGDHQRAQSLSRLVEDVVHAIAKQVEHTAGER